MHERRIEIRILFPQLCLRLIDLGNSFVYARYAFKVPSRPWRSRDGCIFRTEYAAKSERIGIFGHTTARKTKATINSAC